MSRLQPLSLTGGAAEGTEENHGGAGLQGLGSPPCPLVGAPDAVCGARPHLLLVAGWLLRGHGHPCQPPPETQQRGQGGTALVTQGAQGTSALLRASGQEAHCQPGSEIREKQEAARRRQRRAMLV